MNISISEENKMLIEDFKNEAILIKQEVKELSIDVLIQLKTFMFQFLISYKEYSLTNIREYGLAEILMSRAMRFFKLDQDSENPKKIKKNQKSKFFLKYKKRQSIKVKTQSKIYSSAISKKKVKSLMNKLFKITLFPFYIIIQSFRLLFMTNIKEKASKGLKNSYKA